MKVGIIDVGTNSVRFFIYKLGPNGKSHELFKDKAMVRLGENLFESGKLDTQALTRTIAAFEDFRKIVAKYKPGLIKAVGTSALREAKDPEKLLDAVREKTGISIQIIPGAEEARLIAMGILSNLDLPPEPHLFIDVGGGSTEVSVAEQRRVLFSTSLPIGAARGQQLFLHSVPPGKGRSSGTHPLRIHVRRLLRAAFAQEKAVKIKMAIGSSGSLRALGRIYDAMAEERDIFTLRFLSKLVRQMQPMTREQLLTIPGLEEKRSDLILAASIIVEEVLLYFDVNKVMPTTLGLKDGILEELKLQLSHKQS